MTSSHKRSLIKSDLHTTVHPTVCDRDEVSHQQTKFSLDQDGHVKHAMLGEDGQQNERVLVLETLTSSKQAHQHYYNVEQCNLNTRFES